MSPEQPDPRPGRTRSHRTGAAVLLIGVLVLVGAVAVSAPVLAAPHQDDETSTSTLTTTEDLLEGSTTAPTTVAPSTESPAVADDSPQDDADDDTRTVWYIVAGLVGVAVFLSVLTYLYWRSTRPVRPVASSSPDAPSDSTETPAKARRTADPSRTGR